MEKVKEKLEIVEIKALSEKGEHLVARFAPNAGMNLLSYKKGNVEIIDQSTKSLFEERCAGLGAMIGPHFHHRDPKLLPKIENEALFPHIAPLKAKGVLEPFSHGIGRYAPWKVVKVETSYIKAVLKGSDRWKGILLKDLEGQDFNMEYEAKMIPQGLEIHLSVVSEKGSVVGLHTYYALEQEKGHVTARVQSLYNDHGVVKDVPSKWIEKKDGTLSLDLDQDLDFGFYPYSPQTEASIVLETKNRQIQVQYWCENEENCWQLWHPKGKSFVCIEPLSAKDPRKPQLPESSIKILISILNL